MLTLALLRHAKSSWADPAEDDFDRALNERGIRTAPEAGAALATLGFVPELILCSTAKRTRETLDLALPAMPLDHAPKIQLDDRLYLASATTIVEVIRDMPAAHMNLLVIGHNPGLHEVALMLAGSGDTGRLETLHDKFPTSAIALLKFERARWRDIRAGDGRLEAFWLPKKG